jgi:Fe-S-cluster-containing dehydrogenase component
MSAGLQFVFDPKRCTGCEACVVGCWMENRAVQTRPWRRVHTFNGMRQPGLPVFHLSLACHHCDEPACLEHCPAGAYTRHPDTGAVVIHPERCMGCQYCTWACPHDAPRFNGELGTVEKCTFCQGRLEEGLEPACVARCPLEALGVEPRTEYRGETPPGFPPSDLRPGLRILSRLRPAPLATAPPPAAAVRAHLQDLLRVPEPRITLRGSWALVVFTTTLAVLVALMGARAAGRPMGHPWLFLGAGLAAMTLSAWHLGRPDRAWRALLNLRRSWLSREIALVAAFLGLCAWSLLRLPVSPTLAWAAACTGLAALFAVDRVYQVATKVGPLNFHSAHALFNGLYLAGILAGWWPLALVAGVLKLGLYLNRKAHFLFQGRGARPWLSLARVVLGFGVPAVAFGSGFGALGAVLGDLLDRCEYYDELEIPTPAACMVRAMTPE